MYLMFPKANQYLQTKKPEPADYNLTNAHQFKAKPSRQKGDCTSEKTNGKLLSKLKNEEQFSPKCV